ncbi:MAG: hypothetical protein ACP5C4_04970 [Methanomicrobiales archaeon]
MAHPLPLIAALLCAVAICTGAGCLAFQYIAPGDGGPAEQVIHPEFYGEGIGTDDYLQYRLVPKTSETATYLLTYEITRNGTTVTSRTGERFTGISREHPITLGVPRTPGDRIVFHVTVYATDGVEVYTATMAGEAGASTPHPTLS